MTEAETRSLTTVLRDGLLNSSATALAAVISLLLVPLFLHLLGAELYGLWLAVVSLNTLLGSLDLGLRWSIIREVAAAPGEDGRANTVRFLQAAAAMLLIAACGGALLVGVLGGPLNSALRLTDSAAAIAPALFALGGLLFLADLLTGYASAVLTGLQRFAVLNLVISVAAIGRAAGTVLLLWHFERGALLPIAAWSVAVSCLTFVALNAVAARVARGFSFRPGWLNWDELRPRLAFGLESLAISAAGRIIWQAGGLLSGLVLGPAHIVTYSVGQRFPLATQVIYWRIADVLFPLAAGHRSSGRSTQTFASLEVVTYWNMLLMLPLCMIWWLIAPELLFVWVGPVGGGAVAVMRLASLTVLADALSAGPFQVLWGRGESRRILAVYGSMAVATIGLTLVGLQHYGVLGAAAALQASATAGAIATLVLAARSAGGSASSLVVPGAVGLTPALAISGACMYGLKGVVHPDSPLRLLSIVASGALIYVATLHFHGARSEHRMLANRFLRLLFSALRGWRLRAG